MPPPLRSPPVPADTQVKSYQHPAHHRARRQHIIPIALAARPVPNFPRLRALALFRRRSVEPAEPPSCRRPKTSTETDVRNLLNHLISDGEEPGREGQAE